MCEHLGLDAVEERQLKGGRDKELAVGVPDQLTQLLPAVSGVDSHQDSPGHGRRGEPEKVVRDVVEQDADVRRPFTIAQPVVQRDAAGGLLHDLPVGPLALLVAERDRVVV